MTHDEYEERKLALLKHYLHLALFSGASSSDPEAEANSLAPQLADALDRLVLEIDPFEAKPGGPRAGGSR